MRLELFSGKSFISRGYIYTNQVHFGPLESANQTTHLTRDYKTLILMGSAKIKEALHANCFGFFLFMAQKSFKRVTVLNEIFPRFHNFDEYDVAGSTKFLRQSKILQRNRKIGCTSSVTF